MTTAIAPGFISGDRSESEVKQALEDMIAISKEMPGGSGAGATIPLATDSFSIASEKVCYVIDTQGSAADDELKRIGGTARHGQIIYVRIADNSRIVYIRDSVGGANEIKTVDGEDYLLHSTAQIIPLMFNSGGAGYWEVLDTPEALRLAQLPGGKSAVTLTIASDIAVPLQVLNKLAVESSTTDTLKTLTMNSSNANLYSVTLVPNNAAHSITLKHNDAGGGNVMIMRDSADVVLKGQRTITFSKSGSTWVEVWRSGFSITGPATTVTSGRIAIYDGTTGEKIGEGPRLESDLVNGPVAAITANYPAIWDAANRAIKQLGGTPSTGDVPTWNGTSTVWGTPATAVAPFVSTQRTITAAGTDTLAHSRGATPNFVQMVLVNVNAEGGYSPGDLVVYSGNNVACKIDGTNLSIRYPTTLSIAITRLDTGASISINYANWKLIFVARV